VEVTVKLIFLCLPAPVFYFTTLSLGCFGLHCVDGWVNNNVLQMEKETFLT